MTDPHPHPLTSLGPEERGAVLALLRMGKDAKLLGYLPDRSIERGESALAALNGMKPDDREAWLAETVRQAESPCPEDISALHPSWIAEAVRGEPLPLVRAIVEGLPEPGRTAVMAALPAPEADATALAPTELAPGVSRDLARILFLPLEKLCARDVGPLAAELRALPFDQLILRVMGLGADLLGRSLHGTPLDLRAKIMATVGEPWAGVIGRRSQEPSSREERAQASVHAGIVLPPTAIRPEDRLFHIGLSSLKEPLSREGQWSVLAVAGRLPHALGRPWLGDAWWEW